MRTLATCVVAVLFPWLAVLAQSAAGYRVIVNPKNSVASLERQFLADAFLKKTTRWSNGATIMPVDLTPDAAVRREFTDDVLKRSVAAVHTYWQQLIFSGRDVPPPELSSDAAVVNYVREHAGAVGYVAPNVDISGTKLVGVR